MTNKKNTNILDITLKEDGTISVEKNYDNSKYIDISRLEVLCKEAKDIHEVRKAACQCLKEDPEEINFHWCINAVNHVYLTWEE